MPMQTPHIGSIAVQTTSYDVGGGNCHLSFGVERTCSSTWKYMEASYDETADEHDPDAF